MFSLAAISKMIHKSSVSNFRRSIYLSFLGIGNLKTLAKSCKLSISTWFLIEARPCIMFNGYVTLPEDKPATSMNRIPPSDLCGTSRLHQWPWRWDLLPPSHPTASTQSWRLESCWRTCWAGLSMGIASITFCMGHLLWAGKPRETIGKVTSWIMSAVCMGTISQQNKWSQLQGSTNL